jgi:hypothetical protein
VEEAYAQQGRAHSRRLHLDWAARLWRGVIYSKGARGPQSITPEGRGGGGGGGLLATEAIGIAFVVHAVEAVGATHGILAVQVVEGVARKRTRCGSCCRAACN